MGLIKQLVVIPAYNEEQNIIPIISKIKELPLELDLLVIDNCSTDNTANLCKNQPIQLITHSKNMGKAYSIIEGLKYASSHKYDYVITIDADLEHDPGYIPQYLKLLESYDVVIGQRQVYRSGVRELLNKWSRAWFNLLLPNISDVQCGYRGFRVSILDNFSFNSTGFEIEMELLLESIKANASITTLNFQTKPRHGSNLKAKDYLYMNNFFDRWVIGNKRYILLPVHKKTLLITGAYVGLSFGSIAEKVLR